MKTLIGTLLALGLLTTAASAQYCPPGYSYGYGYSARTTYGYGHQGYVRTYHGKPIETPTAEVGKPIEPVPVPNPVPAPENLPPK